MTTQKKPTRQNTSRYSIASAYLLTGLLEPSRLPFIESSAGAKVSFELEQFHQAHRTPFVQNSNRLIRQSVDSRGI
jgi:hypothetical protein